MSEVRFSESRCLDGLIVLAENWNVINAKIIGTINIVVGITVPCRIDHFDELKEFSSHTLNYKTHIGRVLNCNMYVLTCLQDNINPFAKPKNESAESDKLEKLKRISQHVKEKLKESICLLRESSCTRKSYEIRVDEGIKVDNEDWDELGQMYERKLAVENVVAASSIGNQNYQLTISKAYFLFEDLGQNMPWQMRPVASFQEHVPYCYLHPTQMRACVIHCALDVSSMDNSLTPLLNYTKFNLNKRGISDVSFYPFLGLADYGNVQCKANTRSLEKIQKFQVYARWTNKLKHNPFHFFSKPIIAGELCRMAEHCFDILWNRSLKLDRKDGQKLLLHQSYNGAPISLAEHLLEQLKFDIPLRFETVQCFDQSSLNQHADVSSIISNAFSTSAKWLEDSGVNHEVITLLPRNDIYLRATALCRPCMNTIAQTITKVNSASRCESVLSINAADYWNEYEFVNVLAAEVVLSFLFLGNAHIRTFDRNFDTMTQLFGFSKPKGEFGKNEIQSIKFVQNKATFDGPIYDIRLPAWLRVNRVKWMKLIRTSLDDISIENQISAVENLKRAITGYLFASSSRDKYPQEINLPAARFSSSNSHERDVITCEEFASELLIGVDIGGKEIASLLRLIGCLSHRVIGRTVESLIADGINYEILKAKCPFVFEDTCKSSGKRKELPQIDASYFRDLICIPSEALLENSFASNELLLDTFMWTLRQTREQAKFEHKSLVTTCFKSLRTNQALYVGKDLGKVFQILRKFHLEGEKSSRTFINENKMEKLVFIVDDIIKGTEANNS